MYRVALLSLFLFLACDTGKLKVVMDIPMTLTEVSGLAVDKENNVFWMVNDSGNKPILYGLDKKGNIVRELNIKAKNRDWEDLTMDTDGNIFIGNFGNNDNDSKALSILKISKDSLKTNQKSITPEVIAFSYPDQKKFPPKKSKRYFDCESFIFYKDSLYLFTKSRVHKHRGKTTLYRLPAKAGTYDAEYISKFNTCDDSGCWVTSAAIDKEGKRMVLLTEASAFLFEGFTSTNFFEVEPKRLNFEHKSQKESIDFKNENTLYIADEYLGGSGGNLYEYTIPKN